MKIHRAIPVRPRWDAVFLVCKACGKRSKAPKGLKPKVLAVLVRGETKRDGTRPRVVQTACLGLCPKGAMAVAYVGGPIGSRIVAVRSRAELQAALPLLREKRAATDPASPPVEPSIAS